MQDCTDHTNQELTRGTKVQVVGKQGEWKVISLVRDAHVDDDPAYEVIHSGTGRSRIFSRSRLQPVIATAPAAGTRRRAGKR
jgi:hypothetical protein